MVGSLAFDWVDLFPESPTGLAGDADQKSMANFIRGGCPHAKQLVREWLSRIMYVVAEQCAQGNSNPLVVIAGGTCALALDLLVQMGDLVLDTSTARSFSCCRLFAASTPGAPSLKFTLGVDVVHPSAHLMKQSPEAKALFRETYRVLGYLNEHPSATVDDLKSGMDAEWAAIRKKRMEGCDKLGIPHKDGWLPKDLRHLRYGTWGSPAFVDAFVRVKDAVDATTWSKLLKMSAYKHMCADYATTLIHWYSILGDDRFTTFMRDSVAARLGEPDFTALLEQWRTVLGDDRFVTFICDSVACRLGEAAFTDQVEHWRTLLGDDRFVTFICGSVACRLGEAAFTDWLNTWLSCMPVQAFVALLSKNGIDARYQVMGGFMTWYASNHEYWTQAMTESLCRAVPLPQKGEQLVMVPAQTWLTIVGHNPQKKRGWRNRETPRDVAEDSGAAAALQRGADADDAGPDEAPKRHPALTLGLPIHLCLDGTSPGTVCQWGGPTDKRKRICFYCRVPLSSRMSKESAQCNLCGAMRYNANLCRTRCAPECSFCFPTASVAAGGLGHRPLLSG